MTRLILAAFLTLIAFAANSVLNRMAVAGGHISVGDFAIWRVAAGAVTLLGLSIILRGRKFMAIARANPKMRLAGGFCLATYMLGFSLAYLKLDAGLGTLLLFGAVQLTMFSGSLLLGEGVSPRRLGGAAVALAGLVWLLLPEGQITLPLDAVTAIAVAGLGWGGYSLLGRKARDPIPETAVNFWIAFGLCALALFLFPLPEGQTTDATGRGLAILSGAVTSGMGYALWYTILPHLGAARAGLAQLSVPPLAILGGVLLLDEVLTLHLIAASLVVIGGVAYGLTGAHKAP